MVMEKNLITLAKVIERCAPPSPEYIRPWLRRLRDLTATKAVPVAARQHEGAGKHRLYDPNIIPLAAVLLRLGDCGVQIGNLSSLARVILHPRKKVDRGAKQVWDWALAHDLHDYQEAWLAISPIPIAGGVDFAAGYGPITLLDDPAAPDTCVIVVYLSRIFRQIKAGG
jgi:hypothetical protein